MPIDYGTNNVNTSGLITAVSGNFTNLTINNSGIPAGSGSNNYIAKWTASNTISSGIVYDNSTGIGIGTSSPSGQFHVVGTGYIDGVFNADNLRIDSNTLSSSNSNGAITISPNGTGNVQLTSTNINIGGGAATTLVSTTSSTSNLVLATNNNSASANISINSGSNGNIIIAATGSGNVNINANTGNIFLNNTNIRVGNGAATTNITTTSASSNLLLATNNNSSSSNIAINSGSNGNIILSSAGSGNINLTTSTNTAGNININNTNIKIGNASATTNIFTTSNTSNLKLATNNGTSSASITINAGANGNIMLSPAGNGALQRLSTGNARGQYATDFQSATASATQIAGGNYSTIGGGYWNTASGQGCTIAGGGNNFIGSTASLASIGGGSSNSIRESYGVIAGGSFNIIGTGCYTSVIGGGSSNEINQITNVYTSTNTIAGGSLNKINGNTIGGGYNTIGGGYYNSIDGVCNVICGGGMYQNAGTFPNQIVGSGCVIVGGRTNSITSNFSSVLGGEYNNCNGDYSSILGGKNNDDGSYDSVFILGTGITATQSNTTYVQNLIASQSGTINGSLGIGISSPSGQLHVVGTGIFTSGIRMGSLSSFANPALLTIKATGTGGDHVYLVQSNDDRGWKLKALTDGNLYIQSTYTTTDTTRMFIDYTSGKVGIGTTSPSYLLHTIGSGYFASGILSSGNISINNSIPQSLFTIGSTIGSSTNVNSTTGYALGIHHSGLMITTPESATDNAVHRSINLLVSKPGNYSGGQTSIDFYSRDRGNDVNNGVMAQIIGGSRSGTINGNGGQLILAVAPSGSSTSTSRITINNNGDINLVGSITEGVVAIGNTGSSQTLSLASGTCQTATLSATCTFTMPTATAGKSFTLFLTQGNNYSATFTSVKWPNNSAPSVSASGKIDIFSFISDGTNWYGSCVQNF